MATSGGSRRIEPNRLNIGCGISSGADQIRTLQARIKESEKLNRPEPKTRFGSLINKKDVEEPELTDKEKKLAALPKRGPSPGLSHPSLRKVFGRVEGADDSVVLKG